MIRQRFIRIAAPLATGLVLASCSDLAAVREFASIPAQPEVYNGLVDEYVQSSDRQKQYVEVDRFPDVDKVTEARRKQTTGLLALHSTLASYMKMLGKLAEDVAVDDRTGLVGQYRQRAGRGCCRGGCA